MYMTIVFGDTQYDQLVPLMCEFDGATQQTTYTSPEKMKAEILCEHCKNFRLVPVELHSVEDLIFEGWIRKKRTTK
jgi:hypothetical protein